MLVDGFIWIKKNWMKCPVTKSYLKDLERSVAGGQKLISTHCMPTFILTCTSAFAKSRCNLFYEEIRLERVI